MMEHGLAWIMQNGCFSNLKNRNRVRLKENAKPYKHLGLGLPAVIGATVEARVAA